MFYIVSCPDPTHSNEEKGLVLFKQFWGLVQNSGKLIRIVPCDLENGNLCYKLDFAAATSCRDTQASSKAGIRARVGSSYMVGGWRTVTLK